MARTPALTEIEAIPEADRLEPFPHPRATAALYGHAAAELVLVQAFAGGRMHHAWLLAGPEGIGKATLAWRLARHVLARPVERDPGGKSLAVAETTIAARQVGALSHPGLLLLRRAWDSKGKRFAGFITVDEVRRLRGFLGHTVEPGTWRVVIVDAADDLNVNAANALLKSLEEPPARTLFLLVVAERGRLLATIRSRTRTLDLASLDDQALRRAATAALAAAGSKPPAEADWPRLERLADGSVRRLLQLATGGGLEVYEQTFGLVQALPTVDWEAAHALSDKLAANTAELAFSMLYDLLGGLLSRLIRVAATGAGTPDDLALARRLIPPDRFAAWAEAWESIQVDLRQTIGLNLDKKALILRTIGQLAAVARQ